MKWNLINLLTRVVKLVIIKDDISINLHNMNYGYTVSGLNNFGKWLYVTRNSRNLWPESFSNIYKDSDKITQRQLATWLSMGYEAEFTQLFLNLIKSYEGWTTIDSFDGLRTATIRYEFALALAQAEFLSLGGIRVDCCNIGVFHSVMSGSIDPFNYIWPHQDIVDDSLASALKKLMESSTESKENIDPKLKPGFIRNQRKLERMKMIEELQSQGMTKANIARHIGISRQRVDQLLKELASQIEVDYNS